MIKAVTRSIAMKILDIGGIHDHCPALNHKCKINSERNSQRKRLSSEISDENVQPILINRKIIGIAMINTIRLWRANPATNRKKLAILITGCTLID